MNRTLPASVRLAAALALIDGSYMILDGIYRLLTGDFIRIGGQLGPWSGIVSALGGDPLAMGPVFLGVGTIQAIGAIALVLRREWGYKLTLIMAVGTLWYLVFGTISSVIQIGLLLVARPRMPEPPVK